MNTRKVQYRTIVLLLNWQTKRILVTRDVLWLQRMYFDKVPHTEIVREQVDDPDDGISSDDDGIDFHTPGKTIAPDPTDETDEANDNTDNESDMQLDNISESSESREDAENEPIALPPTKSGRSRQAPAWMKDYAMTTMDSQNELNEILAVGAGIGGGFLNTSELIPMTYEDAMKTKDAESWKKAVHEEYQRMMHHQVFKPIPISQIPKNAKILTSTWSMKKKANGTFRARLNARGFEQKPGEHYSVNGTSSPTVHEATICILLILLVLQRGYAELNDVKGAFLTGMFSNGEKLYMYVPKVIHIYIYQSCIKLLGYKTFIRLLCFKRFVDLN